MTPNKQTEPEKNKDIDTMVACTENKPMVTMHPPIDQLTNGQKNGNKD